MGFESLGDVLTSQLLQWAHRAEEADGDYRDDDGLLICGVCHQAKETKVDIAGTEYIVACMCDCQAQEWEKRKAAMDREQWLMKLHQLPIYDELRDRTIRNQRFENAEDSVYLQKCKQFADKWDELKDGGVGLLLSGPVGCGKTYAAACIANALTDNGVGVLMTSFPRILKSQLPLNEIVRQSDAFDLIIVDDLGAERDTDYAAETVFQFIDNRYKSKLPLIVTTNLAPKDLREQTDMRYRRIYDRVLEMCIPMVFSGDSRRNAKRKEKAALLRQIINGGDEANG